MTPQDKHPKIQSSKQMESMGNLSMERKNNKAGNYDLFVGQLKALLE